MTMKQSKNLVAAIKGLVDELKVSFPLDNQEAQRLLDDPLEYAKMSKASNPDGDGHAAERIVEGLLSTGDNQL
ncbi:MAG: hypothetical protein HGB11_06585 [Chlorobiales bacterium]|nr:hypothetical protein [Chlorobiales bacterium]